MGLTDFLLEWDDTKSFEKNSIFPMNIPIFPDFQTRLAVAISPSYSEVKRLLVVKPMDDASHFLPWPWRILPECRGIVKENTI